MTKILHLRPSAEPVPTACPDRASIPELLERTGHRAHLEAARAWYTAASEAEIEMMLEVEWAEWPARTPDDWMRIAVVALDQAGVHVADVRVSR